MRPAAPSTPTLMVTPRMLSEHQSAHPHARGEQAGEQLDGDAPAHGRERLAGGRPRLPAVLQARVLAEVDAEHEPEEQPHDGHDEEADDPEDGAQRQRAPRDA